MWAQNKCASSDRINYRIAPEVDQGLYFHFLQKNYFWPLDLLRDLLLAHLVIFWSIRVVEAHFSKKTAFSCFLKEIHAKSPVNYNQSCVKWWLEHVWNLLTLVLTTMWRITWNCTFFQGSLSTVFLGNFTSILLAFSKVKMGQSTTNIFFAENENITPGPPLERFWNLFGHWKHFYSGPTLDPNLGTFRFIH